ncbi:unnamed protein product [Phaedon cochleariae]|uniref:Uncharacterized protein n=1 Tax=Phaedon cochleariae TaxID=80249 RepID=A0A9N9SB20_PHACE|nr:unnamed protein product [Phaedon cochleariae]
MLPKTEVRRAATAIFHITAALYLQCRPTTVFGPITDVSDVRILRLPIQNRTFGKTGTPEKSDFELTSDISKFFRPRSSRDGEGSSSYSQSQPDPTSEDADIIIAVEDGDRGRAEEMSETTETVEFVATASVQENSVEDHHDDCAIDLQKMFDLAKWPNIISDNLKILIVKKVPCQVRNVIFPEDHGRAFSENYYVKRLHNGGVCTV